MLERFSIRLLCTAIALLLFGSVAWAEARAFKEHHVKAVFLYRLSNFIDWPDAAFPDPDSPFTYCAVRSSAVGGALREIVSGKEVRGRSISFVDIGAVGDLTVCHILYIPRSERAKIRNILNNVRYSSVLTVSDTDGFITNGGAMALTRKENRIQIVVNMKALRDTRISVSSKLLRLATVVGNE